MRSRLTEDMVVESDISALPGNIVRARDALRLSQMEVANRMQVDRTVIARYESGKRTPRADNLQRLAAALETTPDALLGKDAQVHESDFEGEWAELKRLVMELPPEMQGMFFTLSKGTAVSLKQHGSS